MAGDAREDLAPRAYRSAQAAREVVAHRGELLRKIRDIGRQEHDRLCGRRGPPIGDKLDDGRVRLVADRSDNRHRAAGEDGVRHDLLVEGPEILDRTAAAGDENRVDAKPLGLGVERPYGPRDLFRRSVPLHAHIDEENANGLRPMGRRAETVVDRSAGRARDDRNAPGKRWQGKLAVIVKIAAGFKCSAEPLVALLERALSLAFDSGDIELRASLLGIKRKRAGDDDGVALAEDESRAPSSIGGLAPHRAADDRLIILQREIPMPLVDDIREFAAHAQRTTNAVERALDALRQLRHAFGPRLLASAIAAGVSSSPPT
jgi:hypothetical protein